MTASFPGGLRAQLLIGLSAMLVVTVALGGIIVENMLTRRLLEERHEQAQVVVDALAASGDVRVSELVRSPRVGGVIREVGGRGVEAGKPAVVVRLRSAALASGAARGVITVDGTSYAVAFRSDSDSLIAVAVEVDSVLKVVAQTRGYLFVFLVVVALFVLAFAAAFFTYLVLRPVRAIGVATERAGQGDFASPISVIPRNEYGKVATSFNRMLERIERNRSELETKVRELERANRELAATRDSLVRSEKLASVGQLAAGIAHEIGNPLAALSGFNEILLDADLSDEERRDLLARSRVQLDRIREVIRSLLDFSREERQASPVPTDLRRAIDEAVGLVSALPQARDIAVEVGDVDGPLVAGISSKIVQVLVNLTMNAVDAMHANGRGSRVRIEREDCADGSVELRVSDDGPGIPEELRARIFDPFFTTKEPGAGTGLGLAISLRIMESLDGDLRIDETEAGARFVLVLPQWEELE